MCAFGVFQKLYQFEMLDYLRLIIINAFISHYTIKLDLDIFTSAALVLTIFYIVLVRPSYINSPEVQYYVCIIFK